MPTVDLSDSQLALLELAEKVGGAQGIELMSRAKTLHDKLYTHKDTAVEYQKLMKKQFPDVQTPTDYAEPFVEPLRAEMKSWSEKMDAFLTDRAKEKEEAANLAAQTDFESRWSGVVKDYELTSEGEEKLLNFMKDRKNADPEAAAALYFKQNPKDPAPIAPSSIAPASWAKDMGFSHAADDTDTKALLNNPEQWADKEAASVLTEIRRNAA